MGPMESSSFLFPCTPV